MMKEINRDKLFKWEIKHIDPIGDPLDDDFNIGCHCGSGIAVDDFYKEVASRNGDVLDRIVAWYKWAVDKSNDIYFLDKFEKANKLDPYFYYPEHDMSIGMSLIVQSFAHAIDNGDMKEYDKELEEYIAKVQEFKDKGVYGDEDEENED